MILDTKSYRFVVKVFKQVTGVRLMRLSWLLILIERLYWSGVWFGVAPRMDTQKTCVFQREWTACSQHDQ